VRWHSELPQGAYVGGHVRLRTLTWQQRYTHVCGICKR